MRELDVYMRRAIDLAHGTVALASPNPQVGCVLVRNGVILGEGAHLYDARDHAEIVALKQAAARGVNAAGATAYVTLEPCSHHGRTGPCADALIAAGVARVVVATIDPNPEVSGRGVAKLRAAGILVEVGLCEREARAMNDAFACFMRIGRPMVTLKAALSVDGMLAPPPATRQARTPFWLTGAEARVEVQAMRHASDAVLTGIGTVLADDPLLTDRTGLARRRPLLRVVLDPGLRIPPGSQMLRGAAGDLLIFCGSDSQAERAEALRGSGAEIVVAGDSAGRIDLAEVLAELGRRKVLSLLLECGSRLNGAFLTQGLVDRAALFYAETELGIAAVPFAEGFASPYLLEQQMSQVVRQSFGPDACVSGYLRNPWAS